MPRRFIVSVPGVPASPSPISNAVVVGDTCHIAGQLAVYEEGYRAGSAREEAARLPFNAKVKVQAVAMRD